MADEEGNVWQISVGQQSRFRGGANQTASVIIPALQLPREAEEPRPEAAPDHLSFHVDDPTYTPEQRERVRRRLIELERGDADPSPVPESKPAAEVSATAPLAIPSAPALPVTANEVVERATSSAAPPAAPKAPGEGPPKKASRCAASSLLRWREMIWA
jgi:hypothetical protein